MGTRWRLWTPTALNEDDSRGDSTTTTTTTLTTVSWKKKIITFMFFLFLLLRLLTFFLFKPRYYREKVTSPYDYSLLGLLLHLQSHYFYNGTTSFGFYTQCERDLLLLAFPPTLSPNDSTFPDFFLFIIRFSSSLCETFHEFNNSQLWVFWGSAPTRLGEIGDIYDFEIYLVTLEISRLFEQKRRSCVNLSTGSWRTFAEKRPTSQNAAADTY